MQTTEEMVIEEVISQTGKQSVSCRPSRHGPSTYGDMTWFISFKEPVGNFQLFGKNNRSCMIRQKYQIQRHSPGCQGYCNPAQCARGGRCGKCAGLIAEHDRPAGENCIHPDQCANCYGPYRSGHTICPAASRRENRRSIRPTRKKLTALRRAGKRAFNAKQKEKPHLPPSAEAQVAEATELIAT